MTPAEQVKRLSKHLDGPIRDLTRERLDEAATILRALVSWREYCGSDEMRGVRGVSWDVLDSIMSGKGAG